LRTDEREVNDKARVNDAMNAEIVNKAADVANSAVNALKASPIVLALVLMQITTMAMVLYNAVDRQRSNTTQFEYLHKTLDACVSKLGIDK